jgi:hypothetical protein
MAKIEESIDGYLEKLALITSGLDEVHSGKKAIVFDLSKEEFLGLRDKLKNIPEDKDKFKIDISGIEIIYLMNE